MDIFIPIIICVIFFVLFSLCGYCCKKHRGTVYGYAGTPVTVTTQHVTATPVVRPPYPVDPHHPIPQPMPMPPQPGFVPHAGGYQSGPYPPAASAMPGITPYPPSNTAPYPPVSSHPSAQTAPPPSYHEAVGQPQVQPAPVSEQYVKQAPYNPNY